MTRPVVGVIANTHLAEGKFPAQIAGERSLRAVAEVAGALPLIFASVPEITDVGSLLAVVDGVLLTGGRANVHPTRFNMEPHAGHEPYDERRDALALSLIEACVARGVPVFGLCRGFQEMNVAFGGTLWQKLHEVEGLRDHREDLKAPLEEQYGPAHEVELARGGLLQRLAGKDRITVNSLHSQGVQTLGRDLDIEARAPDGVVEAFRVRNAPSFAVAVQWHPEWQFSEDPFSVALFAAFGEAARERAQDSRKGHRL
jgi:putative glutamine amidotransferase